MLVVMIHPVTRIAEAALFAPAVETVLLPSSSRIGASVSRSQLKINATKSQLLSSVNFTSLMAFRRSLNNVDFGSHIHCRLD